MTTKLQARPWGLPWRSHTVFILSSVFIGLFSDIFLYCLFVPVLPYLLEDRAGLDPDKVQVHVSGMLAAYAGASVCFSPFAGWIADRTQSRQTPFLCGLTALAAGTVLLYLAPDERFMIAARALMGVSSAVVWSVGLALCMDTVGQDDLGKTLGTAFSITAMAALIGPVLGGVLYEAGGYIGVFGAALAILVVDFAMRLLVIEKRTAAKYLDADPQPPSLARTAADGAADEGSNSNPNNDNNDNENDESRPLLHHRRSAYVIPPNRSRLLRAVPLLHCFRNPAFLAAQFIAFIQSSIFGAFDATVPITAQTFFGFTPLSAGLLFIPLAVVDLFVGPLAGWTVDRFGTKPAAVAGFAALVPGLACLRFVQPGGQEQIALYCVLLAVCSGGIAAIGSPSVVEASLVVGRYHAANPDAFGERGPYAQLYGLNSMVFNAGLTVGPLTFGPLRDAIGYGNMNAVAAGLCLAGGIVSVLYIGKKPTQIGNEIIKRHR